MHKAFSFLFILFISSNLIAQNTVAQRFFYEMQYKPNKQVDAREQVIAILDITKEKSVYRDYSVVSQDSILQVEVEKMKKSGTYNQVEKLIKLPKFSYKVYKYYPDLTTAYIDGIEKHYYGYKEKLNFNWNIFNDKQIIEGYNCQKAMTTFGGREWTAWFTQEIPFPDGPYKFSGLPGLIIKIEDKDSDYVWTLKGNKKINDYKEFSYAETLYHKGDLNITFIEKQKFEKTFEKYKKDPLAAMRSQMSKDMVSKKMPGSDITYGQMFENQNKILKDLLNSTTNPIEINTNTIITNKK